MISIVCAKFGITDKAWIAFFDTLVDLLNKAELDGEFKCYLRRQERHKADLHGRNAFSVLRKYTHPNMVRVSFYHAETGLFRTYTVEWKVFSTCASFKNKPLRDHLCEAVKKPQ